ncbi:TA system VapC family ribonuclease toxin [Glycomyces xiaoerkulensis]|uniref:TA system VapC family ribonuclease toxin n=1 Tax=Glycomyces xiaoerkulensis TaxID=2038139 RepID=UPI000C2608FE|nr:TA system VapC family ribonuclease toxin [Glycomyces xiaoerkulensis]
MVHLLDVNVLVALAVPEHVHSTAAAEWFATHENGFALCPITEGGLVRFLMREGASADTARHVVNGIAGLPGYEFWPDDLSYGTISLSGVVGHRQVTDAYLAGLARKRSGMVATFDAGLAGLHGDVAVLVPKR